MDSVLQETAEIEKEIIIERQKTSDEIRPKTTPLLIPLKIKKSPPEIGSIKLIKF